MPGREDVFQKAMNEGHSAAWDQEWSKAAAAYRKALQEMPDHPKALNSLGLALFQQANFDEALQIYQRVAQIAPQDPIPMEKLAQLLERTGHLKEAIEAAFKAADLFLNQRDVDKAIENWVRVTTLDPEHVLAHSRLALAHERLGHKPQAVMEYIAVASLVQRTGNAQKTTELVNKALQILPESAEAAQAQTLLRTGHLLPKPLRPKGGTGPIAMAQVKQLEKPKKEADSGLDPIAEARKKALTRLAEILFEYTTDDGAAQQQRRGLQALMRGTGQLSMQSSEQTKVVLHLGQAIDAQSKGNETQAAEELEHALEAGFNHPALYFDLGLLKSNGDRLESAIRHLQHAVKHNDFGLAARLLMGQINQKLERFGPASIEYLEALKLADAMIVPAEQSDEIRQMYEPLIEAQAMQTDEPSLKRLCDNINGMLMRKSWRNHLYKSREQMPKSQDGDMPMPLAEVILQAQSSQVLESINYVHQLARAGRLRSAMDEAFQALTYAPTYLPLHTLIGDLLVRETHTQEAIAKYSVVAQAYSVRGEAAQSAKMLRRVIQLAPMDMAARTKLIDQLIARGQVEDAIREYIDLADISYRLAELDMARKTYTTALRFIQQANADRNWNVHILQRMADIDMQRLDWKQAIRVYEQIRTLRPDDEGVRKNLVELSLRMGQFAQANAELESYLSYLQTSSRGEQGVTFIEELLAERPDDPILRRALAQAYQQAGRLADAVAQLDAVAESLLNNNKKEEALVVVNQILLMNPPNAEQYRQLLLQLQAG
ncbi:MAG: tetratricopeptide repeat protein [Anaerolineae bacterium]|nr:tetratricopeptide repeat protein [Anaerolineae bacterium]MCI0610758.1 tetratricopeptide repeat protein [Anaerolineae bacterium]